MRAKLASQQKAVVELRKAGMSAEALAPVEAELRSLEAQVAALRPLQDRYAAAVQRTKAREAQVDAAGARLDEANAAVAAAQALAASRVDEVTKAEAAWVAARDEEEALLRQLSEEKGRAGPGAGPCGGPPPVGGVLEWLKGLLEGPPCEVLEHLLLHGAAMQATLATQAAQSHPVDVSTQATALVPASGSPPKGETGRGGAVAQEDPEGFQPVKRGRQRAGPSADRRDDRSHSATVEGESMEGIEGLDAAALSLSGPRAVALAGTSGA